MSYDLDPIFADLPDESRARAERAMKAGAAVHAAVTIMQAANLGPKYGTDLDDLERLWSERLANHDPEAILAAARDWAVDAHEFPDLADFTNVVSGMQRRHEALVRGRASRQIGDTCAECGDTKDNRTEGWVETIDNGSCQRTVRPCSLCKPEQYAVWAAGCFDPDHKGCDRCSKALRGRKHAA
jgi:hypothetical protein